ncbi:hypothetical protein R5576_15550 [Xanthomonas euvesicatoria]|uniref:Lipoprotein n=1 Tax=Xanthomonas euvesicatoria TaxID=456327 RepID=A0AAX4FMC6_XANEU|nr:hypothetical protein [Xanthomonas euvesicatoria]WOP51494.1 hypothetical protein R5576_15550 [Xanthomonas euvesicatoria]WOP57666.1 hypothetical protein R5577_05875 [Xanthomonas euvesicatoria]
MNETAFPRRARFPAYFFLPLALALLASACSASKPPSSEKEDLLLIRPFPVDATDAHVRFEFEATPKNVNLTQSYIVGLTLNRKGELDPVTFLNNGKSPPRYAVHVEACKWIGDQCQKLPTEDAFQAYIKKEPARRKFFEWRFGNEEKNTLTSPHTPQIRATGPFAICQ